MPTRHPVFANPRPIRCAYTVTASPGHTGTGFPAPKLPGTPNIIRLTGAPHRSEQVARRVCGEGGTGYTLGVATRLGPKLFALPGSGRVMIKTPDFEPEIVVTGKRAYKRLHKVAHRTARAAA